MADHSELDRLAKIMADVVNEASQIIHGGNILGVISLAPDCAVIGGENWQNVKDLLPQLSNEDRAAVEKVFTDNLNLVNKDVQAKIVTWVPLLEKAFELAEQAYGVVKAAIDLVNKGKAALA